VTQLRETAVGKNEKSTSHVTGKKGGRARRAVNGRPAMVDPVTPAPRSDASNESATGGRGTTQTRAAENAFGRGKTSKGRNTPRGSSFRDEGKRGEPQDRQQGETNLHGRGSKAAEVVQNHRAERGRNGGSSPGSSGDERPRKRHPRFRTMEGRSLEIPREEIRLEHRIARIGT